METLPEIIPVRPVITKDELNFDWNQEEVKAYLKAVTEKYVGLVVTAENLPDMEKARREVVRFRTAITKFKADGKRRLKVPADQFAAQCDELIAVVKDVEEPIAMQLSKYEEERKQKLTESITREYQAKASAMGLDMEHWQLDMDARWFNKTAKWSDTCNAIDEMIRGQIAQQKAIEAAEQLRATKIEYSKASVELANQKYSWRPRLRGKRFSRTLRNTGASVRIHWKTSPWRRSRRRRMQRGEPVAQWSMQLVPRRQKSQPTPLMSHRRRPS